MKILCGTDIVEISRIRDSIEKSGETFLNMVFTPNEIEYCESKKNSKYYHYAGRFVAKEAIFKAVSSLLKNKFDISWHNAEVINDKNGHPVINFLNVKFKQIKAIDISISHCKEYAVATVIAMVEDRG